MSEPTYPLFPIAASLGCTLVLVPLSWHLEAWNSGTCFYILWTFIACLNELINSIVWARNVLNVAPVWCDISTRIILGASVGIPAASLCITRRLYKIAGCKIVVTTRADKRRAILLDSLLCVLMPVIYITLSYIVQGHRFNIFEEIGCYPAIYNTLAAYFLVNIWPTVIGLVSATYCIFAIRLLAARRAHFNQFLAQSTTLTSSRYFRLMALAMTEILFTVPFGTYEIYSNAIIPLSPWRGWADTHYDFHRVDQYPSIEWRADASLAIPLELSRWLIPACAFIFFAFFGLAEEARKNYRAAYAAISSCLKQMPRKVSRRCHRPDEAICKRPAACAPSIAMPQAAKCHWSEIDRTNSLMSSPSTLHKVLDISLTKEQMLSDSCSLISCFE